jgi:probable O-glycosylation ligase (exosortase A-associated)
LRDLILLAALLGVVPMMLRAPIVGILAWLWISLMCPHREVFGFLQGFGLNLYIAVLTGLAWMISKERKTAPPNLVTLGLMLFGVWSTLSTYFALDREVALPLWDRNIKSLILALAVATITTTRSRLQAVIWMVVVSIGYYAVKGGGFVLLSGGHSRVFGPEASMIEDNNALGLAMIVLLPLMNYLRVTSARAFVRWGLLAAMGLTLIAVLGTYSRGALVALAAAIAANAVRSRYGVALVAAAAVVAGSLPHLLPPTWFERMSTIQVYNEDSSFAGRVAAWKTSVNIATAHPLLGGGYSAVTVDRIVQQFHSPGSSEAGRAAHSIYFQVLGDTGFAGLAIYLLVLAAAWLNTAMVLAATRGRSDLAWAAQLARMMQVSLVALMVGGAALSMAYYDGFLVLFALTTVLLQVVRRPVETTATETAQGPRWRALPAARPVGRTA